MHKIGDFGVVLFEEDEVDGINHLHLYPFSQMSRCLKPNLIYGVDGTFLKPIPRLTTVNDNGRFNTPLFIDNDM